MLVGVTARHGEKVFRCPWCTLLFYEQSVLKVDQYFSVCYGCLKGGEVVVLVPGYPTVLATSYGRILGGDTGAPLTQKHGLANELLVRLRLDGKRKHFRVHRVICEAFHGPPPTSKHQVNHKNHNRLDNRASNLEWLSPKDNALFYESSLQKQASPAEIGRIKTLYLRGDKLRSIASDMGRSLEHIKHIIKRLIKSGEVPGRQKEKRRAKKPV